MEPAQELVYSFFVHLDRIDILLLLLFGLGILMLLHGLRTIIRAKLR